jgi:group I intron endonuclease
MGFIYKLTSPSGRSYIGQTVRSIEERFKQHKNRAKLDDNHGCVYLNAAIRKHGFDNFKHEILIEINNEFLDEYEVKFIDTYNTMEPNGYNLTKGGRTTQYSEASKQKMSETQKNLYLTDEKIRKHIQMNGFNNKINKDLPMYLCEVNDKKHELIGYRVYMHPANPVSKKFCCKKDLPSAYKRALDYLNSLNELQDKERVQRLDGSGQESTDI